MTAKANQANDSLMFSIKNVNKAPGKPIWTLFSRSGV